MSLTFTSDWSKVDKELKRLQDGPDTHDLLRFERVLVEQYQATQQVVHVRTGSLRNSGVMDSAWVDHTWSGEISYGGESGGFFHDPVWYAQAEQDRGGTHDFMDPTYGEGEEYGYAVYFFLRGEG